EIPVRLRREVEGARRQMTTDLDVVCAALPHRNAFVREIGNGEKFPVPTLFDRLELDAHLLDPLRARDLIAGGVLLALHPFDLRQQSASARFERGELLELTGEVGPPLLQAVANGLEVVSEKCGIEHAAIVPAIRWHAWSGRFEKSSSRRRVSGRDSSPQRRWSPKKCWSLSTSR